MYKASGFKVGKFVRNSAEVFKCFWENKKRKASKMLILTLTNCLRILQFSKTWVTPYLTSKLQQKAKLLYDVNAVKFYFRLWSIRQHR